MWLHKVFKNQFHQLFNPVYTLRGLQSAERSLIISLAFCKTSGLAAGSLLGAGADFGCGPSRDIRDSGTATFIFKFVR